jgi:hypothetical protein
MSKFYDISCEINNQHRDAIKKVINELNMGLFAALLHEYPIDETLTLS